MSIDTPANPPVDAFEAALAVTEVAPVIEEVIAPVIEDVVEEIATEFTLMLAMKRKLKEI